MNALDSINSAMAMASGFSQALLHDMTDDPLRRTSPDTGQHPYWLLGHMVVSEAAVLDQYLLGQPNRFELWRSMFEPGTTARDDMAGAPTYVPLLDALAHVRTSLQRYVDGLIEENLDQPCHENDWPGPNHQSVGECLIANSLHMCIHAGQVAAARLAARRAPLYY